MRCEVRRAGAAEVLPLRAAVLRPGLPASSAVFDGDAAGVHLIATSAGRVVGVLSLLRVDEAWQLRGMAVAAELRGRGVGSRLLTEAHVLADAAGIDLWCNARVAAAGFYERHGWSREGGVFDIATVGPHVRMRRSPIRGPSAL